MGWIIFFGYLVLGVLINAFMTMEKNAKSAKERKIARICGITCACIAMGAVIVFLLLVLGWIWYYICGGALIECEDSFFWKAVWGLVTLIPLGFVIGLIAIIFGWNPPK